MKFGFISAKEKFRISLKNYWILIDGKEAALKNFGINKREQIEIYIHGEEAIKAIEKFLRIIFTFNVRRGKCFLERNSLI